MTTSKPVPPGTPPPSPPPGGPRRPTPAGPPPKFADDLMHLADTLGFKTPARQAQTARAVDSVSTSGGPVRPPQVADEPPVTTSIVAADSEGRTGGAGIAPGAAPFALPPTAELPRFLTPAELVKAVRRAR